MCRSSSHSRILSWFILLLLRQTPSYHFYQWELKMVTNRPAKGFPFPPSNNSRQSCHPFQPCNTVRFIFRVEVGQESSLRVQPKSGGHLERCREHRNHEVWWFSIAGSTSFRRLGKCGSRNGLVPHRIKGVDILVIRLGGDSGNQTSKKKKEMGRFPSWVDFITILSGQVATLLLRECQSQRCWNWRESPFFGCETEPNRHSRMAHLLFDGSVSSSIRTVRIFISNWIKDPDDNQ
jgi:hypothetical protein